ncbi:MAG: glycolate oxidase subunit GlcE [Motiliproteus sp.]
MSDISQQLIEQVQQAAATNTPINIQGRGSKSFMGRSASGTPLSVAEHSGIVSYQPVELVLTARAGTSLQEINAALAEHQQMLPCESPVFAAGLSSSTTATESSFAGASLAGTLACNQSGPARPWQGSIRDLVLGVRLINGKAEHMRFGGQVMKNVAGYDVSRLQAGAMGTLGLITEISLKVLPKPPATATLTLACSADDAVKQMNTLAAQAKPLTGACWLDDRLYLRLSGSTQAVDGTLKQWPGERLEHDQEFWQQLTEQQLSYFSGEQPLWRFSVKPNADPIAIDGPWLLDWGGAQRWLRGEYAPEQLETLAAQAGGQVAKYRGGDRHSDVFHSQPVPLQLIHQRLKQAMDPQGLFNPGRLYSWL